MNPNEGHRQRLRQRFLQYGLDPYPEYQALELLLFYAIPRRDTEPLARALLERFGSLQEVLYANPEELSQVPGIGENAATLIHLIQALYRKGCLSSSRQPELIFTSGIQAGEYFVNYFIGKTSEELHAAFLDKKGKVLAIRCIASGGKDALSLNVRKVVEEAILSHASGVILSHNHPSGIALPSEADNRATVEIREALNTVGIRLLDHVIVADGDYVSLAASGAFL